MTTGADIARGAAEAQQAINEMGFGPTYQYAVRFASGQIDGLGGDPIVLAELLRKGDELIRRKVGPWEVVDHG